MNFLYELTHRRLVALIKETDEKVNNTKLLGFFSSEEKCREVISLYLEQPGFKDFPESFIITKVEADINDFNDIAGKFKNSVYYLSHEWYDGEYDIVSVLGYYSTFEKAQKAEMQYRLEPELQNHQNGFVIDEYKIDEMEWKEGFSFDE